MIKIDLKLRTLECKKIKKITLIENHRLQNEQFQNKEENHKIQHEYFL